MGLFLPFTNNFTVIHTKGHNEPINPDETAVVPVSLILSEHYVIFYV